MTNTSLCRSHNSLIGKVCAILRPVYERIRASFIKTNENRDWRIYADFAQSLICIARPLYAGDDLGLDLDNTVYALDASTIDQPLWLKMILLA